MKEKMATIMHCGKMESTTVSQEMANTSMKYTLHEEDINNTVRVQDLRSNTQ